jgi:hypothetical protein
VQRDLIAWCDHEMNGTASANILGTNSTLVQALNLLIDPTHPFQNHTRAEVLAYFQCPVTTCSQDINTAQQDLFDANVQTASGASSAVLAAAVMLAAVGASISV